MNSAPRLLHIVESAGVGGAQRIMETLLLGARDAGFEVSAALPFDGPLVTRLQTAGIPCTNLPVDRLLDLRAGRVVRELVRRGVDIIHIHTPKAMLLTRVPAVWRMNPKPVVIAHLHGILVPALLADRAVTGTNRIKKNVWLILERIGHPHTDAFVFVTEADRRRGFYPPERSVVIPNGIDPEEWRYSPPPSSGILLFPARLSVQKDPQTLIEAAAILRDRGVDFRLWLAGDGELRPQIEKQISHHRLGEIVTLLGEVADPRPLYNQAQIVVLSTHREGQPLCLLEAMATGRPVVATAVNGIPETLADCGRLVPHSEPLPLADTLQDLLDHPAVCYELSERGRLRFLKHFTSNQMITNTLSLYYRLLAKRAGKVQSVFQNFPGP